jgi:hypothetical protein
VEFLIEQFKMDLRRSFTHFLTWLSEAGFTWDDSIAGLIINYWCSRPFFPVILVSVTLLQVKPMSPPLLPFSLLVELTLYHHHASKSKLV